MKFSAFLRNSDYFYWISRFTSSFSLSIFPFSTFHKRIFVLISYSYSKQIKEPKNVISNCRFAVWQSSCGFELRWDKTLFLSAPDLSKRKTDEFNGHSTLSTGRGRGQKWLLHKCVHISLLRTSFFENFKEDNIGSVHSRTLTKVQGKNILMYLTILYRYIRIDQIIDL